MHAIAKIIARHSGRESVQTGEIVNVTPDYVMLNDRGAARARTLMAQFGAERVFDPDRIVVVFDHHYPAIRIQDAEAQKKTREWAAEQGITKFHAGEGIGHVLFPEKGYATPGALIFGTDSHTVTNGAVGCVSTGLGHSDIASCISLGYNWLRVPEVVRFDLHGEFKPWVSAKDVILRITQEFGEDATVYQAVEFAGPAVRAMPMDERLVLTNMVIDFGGKTGYVQPDETTFEAYSVGCGITFTFGGLKINPTTNVLDQEDLPLPGLYAAGELVGGLYYFNYPGSTGLMAGAVFGRIAGREAASHALNGGGK